MVSRLKNARSVASMATGVTPNAPGKPINQQSRNRFRANGHSHDTLAGQKFKFKEKVAQKQGGQPGQYVNSSRNSGMPLHSRTYRQEAPTIQVQSRDYIEAQGGDREGSPHVPQAYMN